MAINRAALRHPPFWVLAVIVAVAAIVRFRGLSFGLPHTQTRPDETVIIEAARALLSGRMPRFYDYPWLFIWATSLTYVGYFVWGFLQGTFHSLAEMVASWPTHWEPFFLLPRMLAAVSGTLTVLAVYRLGRQIRGETTALASAFFLALAFMHARNSHFGTTDTMMVLLIVWAVSLILQAHESGQRRHALAAGVVAGLAAATKYNALILVVPALVSYAIRVLEAGGRRRAALVDPRLLVFALAFGAAFLVGVPFVLLDQERFLTAMAELRHAMAVGDPRLELENGWVHHLRYSLRYGLGLPLLVTGVVGGGVFAIKAPRASAIVLAFPLVYYGVAGSIDLLFFRYVIPVVPFLCLTAGYAIGLGVDGARRLAPALPSAATWTAAAAAAVLLVWPSARNVWGFDRVLAQTDNRVVVTEWFAAHVPPGASIVQSGGRYGYAQFDRALKYHVWQWDGGRSAFMLNGIRATGLPDWILVQDSPLPSTTQDVVLQYLKTGYEHVRDFHAVTISDALVYDRLDAFYVPYSGFEYVERPGPNFSLYKRVAAPGADTTAAP